MNYIVVTITKNYSNDQKTITRNMKINDSLILLTWDQLMPVSERSWYPQMSISLKLHDTLLVT